MKKEDSKRLELIEDKLMSIDYALMKFREEQKEQIKKIDALTEAMGYEWQRKGTYAKKQIMKVYRREYDGKEEGYSSSDLPNSFLGEYQIEKTLEEGIFSGKWIGKKDGNKYLITQTEVSGMNDPQNGGSRFEVTEIE